MLLVVVYTIYVMNALMAMHNATDVTFIVSVNIMATDLIMLHNVVYNHGNFSEFILNYHGNFVWRDLIKTALKHGIQHRTARKCANNSKASRRMVTCFKNLICFIFSRKSWRFVVDVIFQFCPIYSVHFIVFHYNNVIVSYFLYVVINLVDCV